MITQLTLPTTPESLAKLRAGDEVELTGTLYTGRDQVCTRLCALLENRQPLPVDLRGEVIYFVGPTPARPGAVIGSAGPTTSGRMNPFLPKLIAHGLQGFIGKGHVAQSVKESLQDHSAVYFGAIGGTGALLASTIKQAQVVAFPELLSEALHRLTIENFPAVVICDTQGNDLYVQARAGGTTP